ncbi:MAG: hypothetical protein PF961_18045 [Planctomycetota bacterium]|nr:hypothetical protein [Planctomycetota bacterium]
MILWIGILSVLLPTPVAAQVSSVQPVLLKLRTYADSLVRSRLEEDPGDAQMHAVQSEVHDALESILQAMPARRLEELDEEVLLVDGRELTAMLARLWQGDIDGYRVAIARAKEGVIDAIDVTPLQRRSAVTFVDDYSAAVDVVARMLLERITSGKVRLAGIEHSESVAAAMTQYPPQFMGQERAAERLAFLHAYNVIITEKIKVQENLRASVDNCFMVGAVSAFYRGRVVLGADAIADTVEQVLVEHGGGQQLFLGNLAFVANAVFDAVLVERE